MLCSAPTITPFTWATSPLALKALKKHLHLGQEHGVDDVDHRGTAQAVGSGDASLVGGSNHALQGQSVVVGGVSVAGLCT